MLKDNPSIEDVAETVAENYKRYHVTVEQLRSLQEWSQGQSREAIKPTK